MMRFILVALLVTVLVSNNYKNILAANEDDHDDSSSKSPIVSNDDEVAAHTDESTPLLVLTVATKPTESLKRYLRTAKVNGLHTKVLGLGQVWNGGDVRTSPGGGQKINLIKTEVEKYKNDANKIIMFTDSYDVLLLGTPEKILSQFKMSGAKVLFGAESFCWPDESLTNKYPEVHRGKRFLNSGGYIGYAPELHKLLTQKVIQDADDDQLYFTNLYLDEDLRTELHMKLDSKSSIFHNLNGATSEVELRFADGVASLLNNQYNTQPLVLHGNGPTKSLLSSFGNYLANNWNEQDGCVSCWDDMINLKAYMESNNDKGPTILLALFIERPIPFLEEFFEKIGKIDYPKASIHLFLHNAAPYNANLTNAFVANHTSEYASVKTILPTDNIKEWHARNLAIDHCLKKNCDYYFSVDGESHLDNPFVLKLLIEQNREIIAPLLVRPYKAWSNFWGALSSEGFYARSNDYMDIVKGDRRGVWNVPFISGSYLINGTVLRNPETKPSYISNLLDADMAFCVNIRNKGLFMHISNRVDWGHLINSDNFDTTHKNNELFQIFDNRWDWEVRYLHPNWSKAIDPNSTIEQPCPDVYWFPIVTPRYCKEKVEEVENFGQWSDGSNYDPRLDGGYENVPTVDIHMNQIGFETHFLEMLRLYVEPLQQRVYTGYYHYVSLSVGRRQKEIIKAAEKTNCTRQNRNDKRKETGFDEYPTVDIHMYQIGLQEVWLDFLRHYVAPFTRIAFEGYDEPPFASMNFMVRYKPDEQRELKPHHDTSTYTINIAMNNYGTDYTGGGCRFTRYNCSVVETKQGWMLMHPGKLTHQHEGLKILTGTRYIMISFIDP